MLSLSLLFGCNLTAFAQREEKDQIELPNDESRFFAVTHEAPMPAIEPTTLQSTNSVNTRSITARQQWVIDTKRILENAYGQTIKAVEEDENVIRFVYQTKTYPLSNQLMDEDAIEVTPFQLLSTEYAKPESAMAVANSSPKINKYYAWSNGYVRVASKNAQTLSSAFGVSMLLVANTPSTLGAIVSTVVSFFNLVIDQNKAVSAETHAKYDYQNKVGCAPTPGGYVSVVFVGTRAGFARRIADVHDIYGQPLDRTMPAKDGVPSYNPTNADGWDPKPHFNSDSWIMNEAVRRYQNGLGNYIDVFVHSTTPVP